MCWRLGCFAWLFALKKLETSNKNADANQKCAEPSAPGLRDPSVFRVRLPVSYSGFFGRLNRGVVRDASPQRPRYHAWVHSLSKSWGVALAAAAVALCFAAPAHGFIHVVQKSETLASIAERVYGHIQYERILVVANSLDACGGTSIAPGMQLEVPAVGHRRVVIGETWQWLAKEFLGDEKRAEWLAQANHAKPWVPPEDGSEILVPYNLRYVVQQQSDTIVAVSSKFFADNESAWMLDRYNNVGGHLLHRGDMVLVPLTDLPLTEAGKNEAVQADAAQRSEAAGAAREAQRKAGVELPLLFGEVRGGHYLDAVVRGTKLLALGELTRPQMADIHRSVTEAYVALDSPGLAAASCQAWKTADPSAVLDPNLISPKILSVCKASDPKGPEPKTDAKSSEPKK